MTNRREFRFPIADPHKWACTAGNEPASRLYWWQSMQHQILPEIRDFMDEGWQPETEFGPAGYEVRYFNPLFTPGIGCLLLILECVLLPISLLGWLLGGQRYVEPVGFCVGTRRSKN
jgi:hypothetical protein